MAIHRTSLRSVFSGFREPEVLALGVTQTLGYGTLFYAWGVIAPLVAADLGVSLDLFFAVFTIGLLSTAAFAPIVGSWLDRLGARSIMRAGSPVAALALGACALAPNLWLFGLAFILVEFASCLVLYEAAFAGLAQRHGHAARSRISAVTFVAGFASTIFWPLTLALSQTLGWRETLLIFALAHLIICLPLHVLFLKASPARAAVGDSPGANGLPRQNTLTGNERRRGLILYAIAIIVSGLIYSAVPIHMIGILKAQGLSQEAAAFAAMALGPAQVLARLIDVIGTRHFDALVTGYAALSMLVVAFAGLSVFGGDPAVAVMFAAAFGASQGLITIARGSIPLQLFGPAGYATLVGRINGFRFVVNAAAPAAFALVATRISPEVAVYACLGVSIVAIGTFALIRRP